METLTKQEEDVMKLIWQKDGGFIKEFHDLLDEPKPPYTTVASIVRNLEKKKFIGCKKMSNSNFYSPLVKAEDYKKVFMKGFVKDYFKNSYKELVEFFVADEEISAKELKDIIKIIEKPKSK